MKIKVLHLYYDLMNLYGEYANLLLLEKHLIDQGADVVIDKKTLGEKIELGKYDFVFIGEGTERNRDLVLKDLLRYKDDLINYIEDNKYLLMTGITYEMLGKSIDNNEALGIFDFRTISTKNRITSDVILKSETFDKPSIGFINTSSKVIDNENSLFQIIKVSGESEEKIDFINEGFHYKKTFGTFLTGPILVRNPHILKYFVTNLCEEKNENFIYNEIEYKDEQDSYNLAINELTK